MNNFNELTENETLDINGGGLDWKTVLSYGEAVYDFGKGVVKGFVETAKSFND